MTADVSQEMEHGRRMTINLLPFYKVIEVMRRHTILKITTLISKHEVTIERGYADTRCSGGMAPPSTIPSTLQSTIQRYRIMQLHARVPMPNTILNQILSHSYNADTSQAVRDESLAEQ
jgi:hypothetical protein